MNPLITSDRLRIYRSYHGDIDGILRNNNNQELKLFGAEIDVIWSMIDNKVQDLEIIKKGLVSKEYESRTLTQLKEICDREALELLLTES